MSGKCLVRIVLNGPAPGREARDLLLAIVDVAERSGKTRVLINASAVSAPVSEMECFLVGELVAAIFPAAYKIAVVYRKENINKFIENVAVNRGAYINVVGDEDSAAQWLPAAHPAPKPYDGVIGYRVATSDGATHTGTGPDTVAVKVISEEESFADVGVSVPMMVGSTTTGDGPRTGMSGAPAVTQALTQNHALTRQMKVRRIEAVCARTSP